MVDWDAARSLLEETVAEVFDTTELDLLPTAPGLSVNSGRQPDPSRPVLRVLGTIHLQPPSDRIARYTPADPGSGRTISYEAVMTALVTGWDWQPKIEDKVQDVVSGDVWKVEAIERDGSGRPAFYLSRARHVVG